MDVCPVIHFHAVGMKNPKIEYNGTDGCFHHEQTCAKDLSLNITIGSPFILICKEGNKMIQNLEKWPCQGVPWTINGILCKSERACMPAMRFSSLKVLWQRGDYGAVSRQPVLSGRPCKSDNNSRRKHWIWICYICADYTPSIFLYLRIRRAMMVGTLSPERNLTSFRTCSIYSIFGANFVRQESGIERPNIKKMFLIRFLKSL